MAYSSWYTLNRDKSTLTELHYNANMKTDPVKNVAASLAAIMPNRLQCLDVPAVSDEDCEKAYPGMITRRMVCAGYMDGGRDACNVSPTANERVNR